MRVSLLVGIITAVGWCMLMANTYRLDLEVYRLGVQAWLDGGDLYGRLPDTQMGISLPFIYPPIAAALMIPLTVVPFPVATVLLTTVSIVLLAATVGVTLRAVGLSERWVMLLPALLFIEPIRYTLGYGQVNIILMALVALDCLTEKPRWPRGLLVGVAAAVKLTPLAFLLFFMLRRDRRAALTTLVSFAGVSVIGFVVSWKSSVTFWTDAVFHTEEKVGIGYIANQSILGVLTRAELGRGVWLVLAAVVVMAAVRAMGNATAPSAFGVNAIAMLLVSPISWSHHWVWCVPILVIFATQGHKVMALVGAVLFVAGPHWWFEQGRATLGDEIVANSYFIFAMAALAVLAWRRQRWHSVDRQTDTVAVPVGSAS